MISCFYVEGAGYQENILPRKHKELGYDVSIISKATYYDKDKKPIKRKPSIYYNDDNIKVTILKDNVKKMWSKLSKGRFSFLDRVTEGLYETIESEQPNIIFEHGVAVKDTVDVVNYVRKHPRVKLFIDQHGDYYNTPIHSNDFFNNVLLQLRHKFFVRRMIKKSLNHITYFWGTTPWRVQYLREVYCVPEKKCGLLVMGGDESLIPWEQKNDIRSEYRRSINVDQETFLIITGGKIDEEKNIHLLLQAIKELDMPKVKLVVFGKPTEAMQAIMTNYKDWYIDIGWLNANKVYNWFLTCDLACFPGTHSVLWEQAAASGIPLVCKYWEGMQHINVGGNCLFIKDVNVDSIKSVIQGITNNPSEYREMMMVANNNARREFSYIEIAKRSIGI